MTPLLYPALALLAGNITGFHLWVKYPAPLFLAALAAGLLLPKRWRNFFLLAGLFMLGETLASQRRREVLREPFPPGVYQDFKGRLLRTPEYYLGKTRLRIKTQAGEISVTVNGIIRGMVPGDEIVGSASFYSRAHPCNFGVRNYYHFYSGISAFGASKSRLFFRKKGTSFPLSLLKPLYLLKQRAALKISTLSPGYSGVVSALLLGQRYPLAGRAPSSLRRAGVYHLMAISGTHIALLTYLLWLVLSLLVPYKRTRLIILALFLLLFYLWVEPSPSVNRASAMALLVIIGKLLWRDISLLNIISASLMLSLFANPLAFLSPGFQLTYWVSLGLILFAPLFKNLSFLTKLLAFSSVAFLFSLPITLHHFHMVNFLSPLNNIIGLGLIPGIIFLSALALAGVNFLWAVISFLVHLLFSLDKLNFLSLSLPALPWGAVFVAMLILLLARKKPILAPLVLFLLFYPQPKILRPEVIFLDVGQGDSVLVKCPPAVFLYDTGGGRGRADVGEFITSRALWAQGIRKLNALFISHFHPDHAGGAEAILRNFKVEVLYYSKKADSPLFRRTISLAGRSISLKRGDALAIGNCRIKVLGPGKLEPGPPANSDSLVLLVESTDFSLLLTGDMERQQEMEVLPYLKPITVLKVAHHGSNTSSSLELLQRTRPRYSVISAGPNNPYGFPSPAALERLKKFSRMVLITSRCGAVKIQGRKVQTCLPCPRW